MKFNNRGYMLVEIILASALAFGMAYFMISMTIKLKNKNDDLLVETLTSTDQAIIANAIMRTLRGQSCDNVKNKLSIDGKKVIVDGQVVDIVNSYVSNISLNESDFCTATNNNNNGTNIKVVHINIPINVNQIPDRNFNIKLDWVEKNDQ